MKPEEELPVFEPKTRAEKRICNAAAKRGWDVLVCSYSGDRTNYEMQGDTSGWYVEVEAEDGSWDEVSGRNATQVIDHILRLPAHQGAEE